MQPTKLVKSTEELVRATDDRAIRVIIVGANLDDLPSLRLLPGQSIRSAFEQRSTLTFREDVDGLQVSCDHAVTALDLVTSPTKRAVWNDWTVDDLGTIELHGLHTTGRVQIMAKDKVRGGRIVHAVEHAARRKCRADRRPRRSLSWTFRPSRPGKRRVRWRC